MYSTVPQKWVHVRAKSIISLLATGLVACSLLGCGQRNIKGQVFIVTSGAENIKLGLVDVLVLDEQRVAAYLDKTKTAIEREVLLRTNNLQKAEHELQEARHELEEVRRTDPANQPANLELKFELTCLGQEISDLGKASIAARLRIMQEAQEVRAQRADSLDAAGERVTKALELAKQLAAIEQKENENAPELEPVMHSC